MLTCADCQSQRIPAITQSQREKADFDIFLDRIRGDLYHDPYQERFDAPIDALFDENPGYSSGV